MFLTPAFEASPGFTHLKLCSAVLLSFLRLVIIILETSCVTRCSSLLCLVTARLHVAISLVTRDVILAGNNIQDIQVAVISQTKVM